MTELDAQILAAVAATFSAIATGIAAWTAFYGPQRAAELAEKLRSRGDGHADRRRAKLNVLGSLMAHRKAFWLPEPVNAFNLIDLVYNDNQEVRSAWAEMYLSLTKGIPQHVQEERLRVLLRAMSKDLNLADELRPDDFGRSYLPDAIAEEQLVQQLQRRATLAHFTGKDSSPAANSAGPETVESSPFPPKPSTVYSTKPSNDV